MARLESMFGAGIGLLLVGGLGSAAALARPVDSRRAERALGLALDAELAGDAAGARAAIVRLRDAATTPEEAVARGLLQAWLAAAPNRVPAWSRSADRAAVLSAWGSLEPFGDALQVRAWHHFVRARPALPAAVPAVTVRIDRAAGLTDAAARAALEAAFAARELTVAEPAPLELGVELDASEQVRVGARQKVTGRLVAVLTATAAATSSRSGSIPTTALLRVDRTRRSVRTRAEAARAFAVRRLALDAATATRWAARRVALARGW